MIKRIFQLSLLLLLLSSCLRTRSEVAGQEQEYLYGQKSADNQIEEVQTANATPQEQAVQTAAVIDEKDELIRTLNGRVETLENQVTALVAEKETGSAQNAQKITLLQEALAKMELQIQKLETGLAPAEESAPESVVENAPPVVPAETKKLSTYDTGQMHFSKSEWKKAILSFQKYTDENPKGKFLADAKYKIGVCFQELGMKEEAMAFYEEVVANHAKSEAGKNAKARLGKLKK